MISSSTVPRIRRLIFFAGPPCSGKTYAMRGLQGGRQPELAALLSIDNPEDCFGFSPGWIPPNCPESVDVGLFHYDFLRTWKFGGNGGQFDSDKGLQVLGNCEEVEFVTLLTNTDELRQRFSARSILKMIRQVVFKPAALLNMMYCYVRLRKLYRRPDQLADIYHDWVEFASRYNPRSHYFVETSGSYSAVNLEDIPAYLSELSPVISK